MKIKSLALMLSAVLLLSCMCGCDTIPDTSSDPTLAPNDTTALYEQESTIASFDDDTATTVTTQAKKTTTTKKKTTTQRITTTTQPKPVEDMVWIPESGSKYHSKSTCSNMNNPSQVTKSRAESLGYTPCKRCYG